jgi:type VI secretion system secreted protein VgrG
LVALLGFKDHPSGAYSFASTAQAERAATLLQEAIESRNKTWLGRSTVRTFAAGSSFELTQSTLDALAELAGAASGKAGKAADPDRRFLLTAVTHAGINNLPKDLSQQIAAHDRQGGADLLAPWVDALYDGQGEAGTAATPGG